MRLWWTSVRSILYFLIFLELFFWVGSWVTQGWQSLGNTMRSERKGVYRIMCIGESTTLLGGKDSYPSQLEAILNRQKPGHFQVINQGMAGVGTGSMAERLPQWLQAYRPDMVIAMIGDNDAVGDKQDTKTNFIKKIKIYGVFLSMKNKIQTALEDDVAAIQKLFTHSDANKFVDENEETMNALKHMPEDQKKVYIYIQIAKGLGKDDIAEHLYELFLKRNKNPIITGWVERQYGALLLKRKEYEKFLSVMEDIPSDAWTMEWIKPYCHGELNMERVKDLIERMVQNGHSSLIYGYVASCYEEGGRRDLMEHYLEKLRNSKSSYYSLVTRKNYMDIKNMLLAQGIQPVFVQYPMRDIGPLLSIFENDPDKEKIIFVDNGPSFQKAVYENSYETFFIDRAGGDFGHATPQGNHLLANNIAQAIAGKN